MYPDILQVRKKITTADIGNPKFFAVTGFNEIRTISFMFPNPGTRIPAVKKPEKPRNSWVMKTNLLDLRIWRVLWFRCGGSWVLGCSVLRIWGFVLVRRNGEDGFGGTNLRGVDRVRMGIFFYGMGCKEKIMGCI